MGAGTRRDTPDHPDRPRRRRGVSSPIFVGRNEELARLEAAWADVHRSGPTAVVITGEAGVGKRRLATEALARVRSKGAATGHGRCLDLADGGIPFGPVRDALTGVLPPTTLGHVLTTSDIEEPGPAGRPMVMLRARDALAEHACPRGIALLIENVQWSDRSTRDLLAYLLTLPDMPLLLMLTWRRRPGDTTGPVAEYVSELERMGLGQRLELHPLPDDEVSGLIRGLGGEQGRDVEARIRRQAGGNPFYVEELVAAACRGEVAAMPATLRDAILIEVDQLGMDGQHLLRVAAVGGNRVRWELLSLVADARRSAVLDLLAAGLLIDEYEPSGTVLTFRHALVQEAVYESLSFEERCDLHRRYAECIQGDAAMVPPDASASAEVAHHLEAAGERLAASRAWATAAEEALRDVTPPEAVARIERALALASDQPGQDPRTLVPILRSAARIAEASGDPTRAVQLGRQAIAMTDAGDIAQRSSLGIDVSRFLWEVGDFAGAIAASDDAVRLAGSLPPGPAKAAVLHSRATVDLVLGRSEAALGRGQEALRVARDNGSPNELASAMSVVAGALLDLGRSQDGLEAARAAWHLLDQLDDPAVVATVAVTYLSAVEVLHGAARAVVVGNELLASAEQRRAPATKGDLLHALVGPLSRLGRWPAAEAAAVDARTVRRNTTFEVISAAEIACLQAARGLNGDARVTLATARSAAGPTQEAQTLFALGRADAWLSLHAGNPRSAVEAVDRTLAALVPAARSSIFEPWFRLVAIRAWAEVIMAGSRDGSGAGRRAAETEIDRHLARLHQIVGPMPSSERLAAAALAEAEVRRCRQTPDAFEAWEEAARRTATAPLPVDHAYALFRLGEMLAASPRTRSRALAPLREAHDIAARLGATILTRSVESVIRRNRLRAPELSAARRPAADADGSASPLSAREKEVLALLAAGRSNRQIADELYVTEKTASAHVSNILVKLSVASRGEAVAVGRRKGLISD